ncbi:MAG: hypothetical protein SNJ33_05505 [Rikenellaceae bacterium]
MNKFSKTLHLFTDKECFKQGVIELLERSKECSGTIARLTIFGQCPDDEEYVERVNFLEKSVLNIYGERAPMVSYVTQPLLLGGEFVAEIQTFDIDMIFKELDGLRYLVTEDKGMRRVIMCGVRGDVNDSIRVQSDALFVKVQNVLEKEGMDASDIFKQWNYIPQITAVDGDDYQHYQAFNDSRTEFYRTADWSSKGYPAATGIGMDCGVVIVDIIAVKAFNDIYRIIPIDNDLQQAAHVYSQVVLIGAEGDKVEGKSTPKFERAKALGNSQEGYICFISGTAAIRGEDSMDSTDAASQTVQTIENIEHLISDHTCKIYDIEISSKLREIGMARAYVKFAQDTEKIKEVVDNRWPKTSTIYLLADVCREELLVEIEAVSIIPL